MSTRGARGDTPEEVAAILQELEAVLNAIDDEGRCVSNARFGCVRLLRLRR